MSRNLLPLLIARRYLFAHKSQNAINVISAISALGVMVATAAIVIVLSVFNGLNGLVTRLFGSFDPDLRIEAAEGKSFVVDKPVLAALDGCGGVAAWSEVVEDNALVRYGKRQMPATVMGVGDNYGRVTSIDSIVVEGAFRPGQCLLGEVLASRLSVSSLSFVPHVVFYAPKRLGRVNMAHPERSFVERVERVGGVFSVQQVDYDASRVVASIGTARALFDYPDTVATSISARVAPGADAASVADELRGRLPEGLVVRDKWMQHESFFKMMEVEKLMAFAILLFIALIAAFNIIGSMSMLIFEKKESIAVLHSLGADSAMVTRVFLFEGWLLSVGGAVLGLLLGVGLTLAQERWGLVGFGGDESYIIDAYPVELWWPDVAAVFVSVAALAALAAWYPVKVIVRRYYSSGL